MFKARREDVDVAKCLRKVGVHGKKSLDEEGRERFHAIDIKTSFTGNHNWYFKECSSNQLKNVKNFII